MKVILRLQTNTIVTEIPVEANTSVTIGRSSKSNFKIPDELMSSIHCKITLRPPRLDIVDLDSKNGTYLNGLRVEQSDIFMGDEIKIGSTKITILSEKMDPNSVNALTFPGATKERYEHGLKLDFTGARMINQGHGGIGLEEKKPTASANKELEVRKLAHSKIKLSKQEIKLRHKREASLASTLDTILMVLSVAFSLIVTNLLMLMNSEFLQENRLAVMAGMVVACFMLFYVVNFKLLKFTIGEKLTGIQRKYEEQN